MEIYWHNALPMMAGFFLAGAVIGLLRENRALQKRIKELNIRILEQQADLMARPSPDTAP